MANNSKYVIEFRMGGRMVPALGMNNFDNLDDAIAEVCDGGAFNPAYRIVCDGNVVMTSTLWALNNRKAK